jgi:hypothetical protein
MTRLVFLKLENNSTILSRTSQVELNSQGARERRLLHGGVHVKQ